MNPDNANVTAPKTHCHLWYKMWYKVRHAFASITIEPLFFLYAMCLGFYIIISKNLYIAKVCNVNLNYTAEICDNIQEHEEEQIVVQQYTSSLQAYNSIIQAVPSCIYALFAGPWSDRHGRKMLMVCSIFGYVLVNVVFMINTYFFHELKAEYLLFECLQDMTGGSTVFYMACYSYIADISPPETRTKRIAFLDGLFPIGFYIGNALSGPIQENLGFMYNFSLGMLCAIMSVCYTLVFVKDSRVARDLRLRKQLEEEMEELTREGKRVKEPFNIEESEESKVTETKRWCSDFFNLKSFKEGFMTVLKKRDHHKRTFIILLILAFELEMFSLLGKWNSQFLFFRKHLKWSAVEYSRYITVVGIIGLIAQYLAVPFLTQRLKFHDSTVSLIDSFTSILNQFVIAYAVNEWMLYVGSAVALLDSTSTTMFRSMISKNVHANEVGKVFSVVGTFQALMPFAAGPLFGLLYKNTVATIPNAFLFLIAGIKFCIFVVVACVNYGMRREEKRTKNELMHANVASIMSDDKSKNDDTHWPIIPLKAEQEGGTSENDRVLKDDE